MTANDLSVHNLVRLQPLIWLAISEAFEWFPLYLGMHDRAHANVYRAPGSIYSIERFHVTSQVRHSIEMCGKNVWHLYGVGWRTLCYSSLLAFLLLCRNRRIVYRGNWNCWGLKGHRRKVLTSILPVDILTLSDWGAFLWNYTVSVTLLCTIHAVTTPLLMLGKYGVYIYFKTWLCY